MRKNKFSLISLTSALLVHFFTPVHASEFTDVPFNYKHYNSINYLTENKIINGYNDGTFKPDATIKRAEFCKIIIGTLNPGDDVINTGCESGFSDVESSHWSAGNIRVAHESGIISGYNDGTFRPDDNVTYEQAVKMIVCAISDDLNTYAISNGGYPSGYITAAESCGILCGTEDSNKSDFADRGTIARLIHNMIMYTDKLQENVITNTNEYRETYNSDGTINIHIPAKYNTDDIETIHIPAKYNTDDIETIHIPAKYNTDDIETIHIPAKYNNDGYSETHNSDDTVDIHIPAKTDNTESQNTGNGNVIYTRPPESSAGNRACYVCGGTRKKVCGSCKGKGFSIKYTTKSTGFYTEMSKKTCTVCHGRKTVKCTSCPAATLK